jgi:hypothetical protein
MSEIRLHLVSAAAHLSSKRQAAKKISTSMKLPSLFSTTALVFEVEGLRVSLKESVPYHDSPGEPHCHGLAAEQGRVCAVMHSPVVCGCIYEP